MIPYFRFAAAAVVLAMTVCAAPLRADSPVRLALRSAESGRTLPPDYLGLSFETQRTLPDPQGHYYFRADNAPLIALFKTLGIKSLRIGGNTADRPTVNIPDEHDLDALFAFAKAADVKVIYTLRLRNGSPEASAKTARYIWEHDRDQLAGFAIGNEPNVFASEYPKFLAAWKDHEQAVLAVAPGAFFYGPAATSGKGDWARNFAQELAPSGKIAGITFHLYPGGNSELVKDPAAARQQMLSPEWLATCQKLADSFVPTVLQLGLPYRLDEANSFWNGGAKDVSDTQAASIWALDYLWWWAAQGASGLNFHTGDTVAKGETNTPCYYALFWSAPDGYAVHPVAYAFKAFDAGFGHGQGRITPVTIAANADHLNLTAFGVRLPDRSLLVTIINKEIGPGARTAEITTDAAAAHVQTMRLESRTGDPAAKDATTFGGSGISDAGAWTGDWSPQGGDKITLPPTSAIVLRLSDD